MRRPSRQLPPRPAQATAPELAPPTQLSAEPELAADASGAVDYIAEDDSAVMAATSSKGRRGASKAKHGTGVVTTSVEVPPAGPKEYTGQRISLDFKDADIQNVLRILADVSGLNIITTDDVQGKITMRLVDVPWDQALDSILKARGLDMVRDGNIIAVSTVEKLKEEREALRAANEAQAQAEPLRVRYVKVNYAKADEKFVKKVQEILTERGSATWDERTNTIVIRDIDRGIADAEELISHFDTQTPQILIEASIVEATENFARDLGVQWGYTYKASPRPERARRQLPGPHQRRRQRARYRASGRSPLGSSGRRGAVHRRLPRLERRPGLGPRSTSCSARSTARSRSPRASPRSSAKARARSSRGRAS
jgi:hypothetical protein